MLGEGKLQEYHAQLTDDLTKIQAATGINDPEELFTELGSLEQENFKQLSNINELNRQIEDLEAQLKVMKTERVELQGLENRNEASTRFQFFARHQNERSLLESEISELEAGGSNEEARLAAQLKELQNVFYSIGCDKLIDRNELKSDFLGRDNLYEVLRVIENRMLEVLFVHHLIISKVG